MFGLQSAFEIILEIRAKLVEEQFVSKECENR